MTKDFHELDKQFAVLKTQIDVGMKNLTEKIEDKFSRIDKHYTEIKKQISEHHDEILDIKNTMITSSDCEDKRDNLKCTPYKGGIEISNNETVNHGLPISFMEQHKAKLSAAIVMLLTAITTYITMKSGG